MIALTATVQELTDLKYFYHATDVGQIVHDVYHNCPNAGVVAAYQKLYEKHQAKDVLVYMHDDAEILDADWVQRVALELADPKVAIVGLGGAEGIGCRDIYKTPYNITQLIRRNYWSNQSGWEIHGKQETGARDVAVLDGFCMAVKTELLKRCGGWSWIKSDFHVYDTAMCLMAHRLGYKVRMVGVRCDHHGGGTSTKEAYAEWCKERGTTVEREHIEPHKWLYDEFRDLLPMTVAEK